MTEYAMDLGKMLADAIVGSGLLGIEYMDGSDPRAASFDGRFDLNAAAEAFLAKVREAEYRESRRQHPRGAVTISPANGGEAWMANGVLSYPSPGAAFDAWMAATEPQKERSTPREVIDDTKARYPNVMDRLAKSEREQTWSDIQAAPVCTEVEVRVDEHPMIRRAQKGMDGVWLDDAGNVIEPNEFREL
jgi:hypothetical protein